MPKVYVVVERAGLSKRHLSSSLQRKMSVTASTTLSVLQIPRRCCSSSCTTAPTTSSAAVALSTYPSTLQVDKHEVWAFISVLQIHCSNHHQMMLFGPFPFYCSTSSSAAAATDPFLNTILWDRLAIKRHKVEQSKRSVRTNLPLGGSSSSSSTSWVIYE